MSMQSVSELTPEPIDRFFLTEEGANVALACQILHTPALEAFYGSTIPDPQAAVQDDGQLVIFWDMGGDWPIAMRMDHEQWSRR